MADLNLTELRKVAEAAATNAEWDFWYTEDGRLEMFVPNGTMDTLTVFRFVDYDDCPECARPDPADAAHIATFDPPTVLALLDRVGELEATVARVEADRDRQARAADALDRTCDELVESVVGLRAKAERLTDELRAALDGDPNE